MRCSTPTPLDAVARGAVAGAVGTLAMDLVWYRRYRRDGGRDGFPDWEFSAGGRDWDGAGAPAQVAKRVVEGFLQRELPAERAAITNNVVHWLTGTGWGGLFGLLAGSLCSPRLWHGLLFAPVVWIVPYLVLPPTGIYKPISEYEPKTLWQDASAHLVYGLATAATFRLLTGAGRASDP